MSISRKVRIAVVGGGLGGCAVAAFLQRAGFDATVYEQAAAFMPVGAGIHLSPNLMWVLRALSLEPFMRDHGDEPKVLANRVWHDGSLIFALPLAGAAEEAYGAPYVTIRRGDLHAGLMSALRPGSIRFSKRLAGLQQHPDGVVLTFADGTVAEADALIGADGLKSRARQIMHGVERPRFSGQASFRASYPVETLGGWPVEDMTKWWAPDRFVLSYFLDKGKKTFYFAAMMPQAEWSHETSSVIADPDEMMGVFSDFEQQVQIILRAGTDLTKWALFEHPAEFVWGHGRVVLLGDACHAMRPFMAQGAAMALEDAAILSRCLMAQACTSFEDAFATYASTRTPRLDRVHKISSENTWLRDQTEDPRWVFCHDTTRADIPMHSFSMS